MVKARWSFCRTCASRRPLYCCCVVVVGFTVLNNARSGTPSRPPPTPGLLVELPYVGSCVPSADFNGEPTSRPPVVVAQFTPSASPICAQVVGMMPAAATPSPLYVRYFDAMLPEAAAVLSNCEVSYQLCP